MITAKPPKKKGITNRIRYASDILVELLPNSNDHPVFRIRRLRQEARVALIAINYLVAKITKKNRVSKEGDVLTLKNAHMKMKTCMDCLYKWMSLMNDEPLNFLFTRNTLPPNFEKTKDLAIEGGIGRKVL